MARLFLLLLSLIFSAPADAVSSLPARAQAPPQSQAPAPAPAQPITPALSTDCIRAIQALTPGAAITIQGTDCAGAVLSGGQAPPTLNQIQDWLSSHQTPPTSLQVVSTSTPALNATYAIDLVTQQKIQAVSLYIAVNGKFPGGQTQLAHPDASGVPHLFPTTASWQAFATAMADYITLLALGQNPQQPVTIP